MGLDNERLLRVNYFYLLLYLPCSHLPHLLIILPPTDYFPSHLPRSFLLFCLLSSARLFPFLLVFFVIYL